MLEAAEEKATEPVEKVVLELTRATAAGANDVILLSGNGCGTGAIKIVRSMFESSWTAEYLRRNPKEVDRYLEFGAVLARRRYEWLLAEDPERARSISPEAAKSSEDEYNRVKARFTKPNGHEMNQWCTESIGEMARKIGRGKEYKAPYSIACSIQHANFEGLSTGFQLQNGTISRDFPPSMRGIKMVLATANTQLWFALDTLDSCCNLGLSDKLKTAEETLHKAYKK
ncbi:MAG TPA: DUF5677 domain-containing protein [Candidatus Acidoferrales bacterium]|nr:DUF5677 domain-containing protein [Candidatus Acidoferrales bacterium]